jgi:UDP-N-acetylglucosamine diphosphorylase / glucose-1-phosphate thymidylyltransferase / UDP-N-acetylgalactosamine diphosphorylase / glucosamine-1-phosphate N-acetyltransferase / galactosamine-1-phosphate N-acetyltransferase
MNIVVALLCAGKSSRINPLSDKIFFEYFGKTLLEHKIQSLLDAGISEIIIIGNTQNISRLKEISQKDFPSLSFSFVVQKIPEDGMKGAICSLKTVFPKNSSLFIVSSNDIVENSYIKEFISVAKKSSSSIFLCGKTVEQYFPGGYLVLEKEKYVKKIIEKPGEGNTPSSLVNLVFHFFKDPRSLFSKIEKEENSSDDAYEKTLQSLFSQGVQGEVIPYLGEWRALKYPWHHLDIMQLFLSKITNQTIHPSAQISKKSSLSGPIIIEEGVKIFDYAVISGPVYIGKNCIIANQALVRHSHIGENCVVGYTTEIARSYLRRNISTHQNYIGDSVLDENINLGAGTRTGNLRFDEKEIHSIVKGVKINCGKIKFGSIIGKDVRIGINTSIMPGIMIGEGSFLSAGLVITENIPINSFVKGKNNFEVVEKRKK